MGPISKDGIPPASTPSWGIGVPRGFISEECGAKCGAQSNLTKKKLEMKHVNIEKTISNHTLASPIFPPTKKSPNVKNDKYLISLARQGGLEPPAYGLEVTIINFQREPLRLA